MLEHPHGGERSPGVRVLVRRIAPRTRRSPRRAGSGPTSPTSAWSASAPGATIASWVGNVYAIGNSYAFVEPLESTGLLMITRAITSLVRAFPIGADNAVMKRFVNTTVGRDWDRLRWFLAAHYKFNRRLDSRFWSRRPGGRRRLGARERARSLQDEGAALAPSPRHS